MLGTGTLKPLLLLIQILGLTGESCSLHHAKKTEGTTVVLEFHSRSNIQIPKSLVSGMTFSETFYPPKAVLVHYTDNSVRTPAGATHQNDARHVDKMPVEHM
jgi:hypothetical protein